MKCDAAGCTWEGSQLWEHKAKIHGVTKASKNSHMKAVHIAQMIETDMGSMSIEDLTFIRNQIDSAINVVKYIEKEKKQQHKPDNSRIQKSKGS